MMSKATPHPPALSRTQLAIKLRVERKVKLVTEVIELGGRAFNWSRVTNPDDLLIAALADPKTPAEELDPFWAATWRAAIGLDRFLQRLDLQGVRVLELGCGSGKAGIGAAAQGAHATLTDAVGIALQVAKLNGWPIRERLEFRRLKWDNEFLGEQFPIILGSDLVYDPSVFEKLIACADRHLQPNGRLYLSEPHRHTGDRFSSWIRSIGWSSIEHDVDLQDNSTPIRIFECWN